MIFSDTLGSSLRKAEQGGENVPSVAFMNFSWNNLQFKFNSSKVRLIVEDLMWIEVIKRGLISRTAAGNRALVWFFRMFLCVCHQFSSIRMRLVEFPRFSILSIFIVKTIWVYFLFSVSPKFVEENPYMLHCFSIERFHVTLRRPY